LQAYGIRTLQTELAHNASEAAALAEKLHWFGTAPVAWHALRAVA
jgi:hypothetical protein